MFIRSKQPEIAAFYPFADFSPEWIAIKYALYRQIPIRFIDLPWSIHSDLFNLDNEDQGYRKLKKMDPLGLIAHKAGYNDREQWWEVTFESYQNEVEVF